MSSYEEAKESFADEFARGSAAVKAIDDVQEDGGQHLGIVMALVSLENMIGHIAVELRASRLDRERRDRSVAIDMSERAPAEEPSVAPESAGAPPRPARAEGDPGTWSFCGRQDPHAGHVHEVTFNEGTYHNVHCNGLTSTTWFGSVAWLSTNWDDHLWFPFVEDENGNITGFGHQDKDAFASAVTAFDRAADPVAVSRTYVFDVQHQWVTWNADTELFTRCTETTPDALPVTTVWGTR